MEFDRMIENETMLPLSEAKRKQQKGVTTVEYAVMLVVVAIVVMTATPDIGSAVKSVFGQIVTKLTA